MRRTFFAQLPNEGLFVMINSDDPPMFDTALTDENLRIVDTFNFDSELDKRDILDSFSPGILAVISRFFRQHCGDVQ